MSFVRRTAALLLMAVPSWAQVDVVHGVASRIALKEGFYKVGSLARKLNNPGALVFARQGGASKSPWKSGSSPYARFKTEEEGWLALENDIRAKLARGYCLGLAWKYLTCDGGLR